VNAPLEAVRQAVLLEAAAHRPGAVLLVANVRRRTSLSKDAFDLAVLELSRTRELDLHHTDAPCFLSPAERAELVAEPSPGAPQGLDHVFYVAVSPRRR
jgi:hypothetical protein